jgi:hypothetical protein
MRCYAALPLCLGLIAGAAFAADQTTPRGGGGHPAVTPKSAPKAAQPMPAQPKPAQPKPEQPGRAGNPANRQSEQLEKLLEMKPEDREKFLQNLPPQRRQNIEKRLGEIEKMAPARRTRVLTQLEMLNSLPPQKQQLVRRSMRQLQELPEERKALIRRELLQMAPMPDEQRREHMNSEEFRNRYSITEQQMMSNLSEVTPP